MNYIKISDKMGKMRNWMIEEETDEFYKVFCLGQVATIRKDRCSIFDGQLISYEILNIYDDKSELITDKISGGEQCSICFRDVHSLDRLYVTDDDKYICKKCKISYKVKAKEVRNP